MELSVLKNYNNSKNLWEVNIQGELDVNTKDKMLTHFDEMLAGEGDIRFNIENLAYMDSTGLGTFVNFYKKMTKLGRKSTFVGMRSNIAKIVKLTGLDEIFQAEVILD